MSIAPFLPGLPVPATPDGGTTPDASAGEQGSAFGDALAAALAGTLAVVPAPAAAPPGPAATPSPSLPFSADPGVPPVDVGLPPVGIGIPPADVGIPPVDLGVAPAELGVASVELGVAPAALGVAPAESAGERAPVPVASDEARATVADTTASALRRTTDAEVRPTGGSTAATDETPHSIEETPRSTGAIPGSTSGIPSSPGGISGSTVTKAVVQQVFPEVTRIVSTVGTPGGPGNGTHRITLTLQPEQLGEVRVTLVVRDGAVHVRLAGAEGADGAAVHRALASEAPELQRILERTGADARVTVRDPFAPLLPPAPSGSTPLTSNTQTGPDAQGRSETQARQEQSAREQPREQPPRQEPQRASYPVEPTPVAGRLDRTV